MRLLPSAFTTDVLYTFFIASMRVTCPCPPHPLRFVVAINTMDSPYLTSTHAARLIQATDMTSVPRPYTLCRYRGNNMCPSQSPPHVYVTVRSVS
jgi:hypothetical protein